MQGLVAESPLLCSATSFDTSRLDTQKLRVRNLEHKIVRLLVSPELLDECEHEGFSWPRRAARLVRRMCEADNPTSMRMSELSLRARRPLFLRYIVRNNGERKLQDERFTNLVRSAIYVRTGAMSYRRDCLNADVWRLVPCQGNPAGSLRSALTKLPTLLQGPDKRAKRKTKRHHPSWCDKVLSSQ